MGHQLCSLVDYQPTYRPPFMAMATLWYPLVFQVGPKL